jgi:hypothetical protein
MRRSLGSYMSGNCANFYEVQSKNFKRSVVVTSISRLRRYENALFHFVFSRSVRFKKAAGAAFVGASWEGRFERSLDIRPQVVHRLPFEPVTQATDRINDEAANHRLVTLGIDFWLTHSGLDLSS